jgi:hypothetical protein
MMKLTGHGPSPMDWIDAMWLIGSFFRASSLLAFQGDHAFAMLKTLRVICALAPLLLHQDGISASLSFGAAQSSFKTYRDSFTRTASSSFFSVTVIIPSLDSSIRESIPFRNTCSLSISAVRIVPFG